MTAHPSDRPYRPRILFVDDEPIVLDSIRRNLTQEVRDEWELLFAGDGRQALETIARQPVDVVVTDIAMPVMDGQKLIETVDRDHPDVVLVVLSGHWSQSQAFSFAGPGVRFLAKPVSKELLIWAMRQALADAAARRAVFVEGSAVVPAGAPSGRAAAEARRAQKAALSAMAKVAEHRDTATGSHVLRVARLTHEIARSLHRRGIEPESCDRPFLQHVGISSILHDVGKVGIPDAVLLKPAALTAAEREIMQRHTGIGRMLLDDTRRIFDGSLYFKLAAEIAGGHHEWWDGTGYPDRLAATDIPLGARIVAVADVYDALCSKRSYKEAWAVGTALAHMRERRGTQFDPAVIDSFLEVLSARGAAATVDWSDRIAVGHPAIDDEHRELFELMNQLSAEENEEDPIVIEFALDELMDYVHRHFENEEELMRDAGFPELEAHRQAHGRMLDEAHDLQARFLIHGKAVGKDLAQFLKRWLIGHIMTEDRKYMRYLAA